MNSQDHLAGDNGEALRALFHGLCLYWGIPIKTAEDPGDPSDFRLTGGREYVWVVIVPEPAGRQVEIASLLSYGNHVLILDRDDIEDLRTRGGGVSAGFLIEHWLKTGDTNAIRARQRMGITS